MITDDSECSVHSTPHRHCQRDVRRVAHVRRDIRNRANVERIANRHVVHIRHCDSRPIWLGCRSGIVKHDADVTWYGLRPVEVERTYRDEWRARERDGYGRADVGEGGLPFCGCAAVDGGDGELAWFEWIQGIYRVALGDVSGHGGDVADLSVLDCELAVGGEGAHRVTVAAADADGDGACSEGGVCPREGGGEPG